MALDFHLEPVSERNPYVSIGLGSHGRLMGLAELHHAALLLRVHEYYDDARFDMPELRSLNDEAARLRELCPGDPQLQTFLTELLELTERALRAGCSIRVIAD